MTSLYQQFRSGYDASNPSEPRPIYPPNYGFTGTQNDYFAQQYTQYPNSFPSYPSSNEYQLYNSQPQQQQQQQEFNEYQQIYDECFLAPKDMGGTYNPSSSASASSRVYNQNALISPPRNLDTSSTSSATSLSEVPKTPAKLQDDGDKAKSVVVKRPASETPVAVPVKRKPVIKVKKAPGRPKVSKAKARKEESDYDSEFDDDDFDDDDEPGHCQVSAQLPIRLPRQPPKP
ncbi:hypothetical protein Ciccas_012378 [Cichlidogyrus casuarinus]|uniref:Uncharacterized protein n=1 Tax=Cichlidogyrus casuarinus TaxID=1844966 RepID=A0ABD2PP09_9PLAT